MIEFREYVAKETRRTRLALYEREQIAETERATARREALESLIEAARSDERESHLDLAAIVMRQDELRDDSRAPAKAALDASVPSLRPSVLPDVDLGGSPGPASGITEPTLVSAPDATRRATKPTGKGG